MGGTTRRGLGVLARLIDHYPSITGDKLLVNIFSFRLLYKIRYWLHTGPHLTRSLKSETPGTHVLYMHSGGERGREQRLYTLLNR